MLLNDELYRLVGGLVVFFYSEKNLLIEFEGAAVSVL